MLKMIGTLVKTALLVNTLITASPVANPLEIEQIDGNTFVIRDDSSPDVKTQVSMVPQKANYGNASIDTIVMNALGPACLNDAELCDTDAPSLSQPTYVYGGSDSDPTMGNLVFTPAGQFAISMGQNYVQALAAVADKVKQGKSESWEVACVSVQCEHGLGSGSEGTYTFYYAPQSIDIVRFNTSSGAIMDSLSYSVKFQADPSETFSWCDLLDITSLVAAAFSPALTAVFGVAGWVCGEASDSS